MPEFMPALELNRRFYFECVKPVLDHHFPSLAHAAALIGYGSEVLGFDTAMSMDHNWYPRVYLFLQEKDDELISPIREMLSHELPHEFLGFSVDTIPSPDEPGTRHSRSKSEGLVDHMVVPTTLRDFVLDNLAWDIAEPLTPLDWLTLPSQVLRTMTAGAVYFDNIGELTRFRESLTWYPHDVWLFLMASTWDRIGQEEHLMPRAGFVGDEPGSAIIGSRLVRDIMSLCFLMEKQYAPYPKWFGSGFKQLACAEELTPILWNALQAENWELREQALVRAYEILVEKHNDLKITEPMQSRASSFHGRPFNVIHGDSIAHAISLQIADPQIKSISKKGLIGGIDQWCDNSELRSNVTQWRNALIKIYM
jgi:hypothetical protein